MMLMEADQTTKQCSFGPNEQTACLDVCFVKALEDKVVGKVPALAMYKQVERAETGKKLGKRVEHFFNFRPHACYRS